MGGIECFPIIVEILKNAYKFVRGGGRIEETEEDIVKVIACTSFPLFTLMRFRDRVRHRIWRSLFSRLISTLLATEKSQEIQDEVNQGIILGKVTGSEDCPHSSGRASKSHCSFSFSLICYTNETSGATAALLPPRPA